MSNILPVNDTQLCEFAPGRLNASLTERARAQLSEQAHVVQITSVADVDNSKAEVDAHLNPPFVEVENVPA